MWSRDLLWLKSGIKFLFLQTVPDHSSQALPPHKIDFFFLTFNVSATGEYAVRCFTAKDSPFVAVDIGAPLAY